MRKQQLQTRMLFIIMVFLLAGIGLAGRLFYIQIIRGPEFARAAVIQRSLRQVYATGRGQILDRNGKSLLDTVWEPVLIYFRPHSQQGSKVGAVAAGQCGEAWRCAYHKR
jgi:cell division protein FtsI/penicillin-binding protein 2